MCGASCGAYRGEHGGSCSYGPITDPKCAEDRSVLVAANHNVAPYHGHTYGVDPKWTKRVHTMNCHKQNQTIFVYRQYRMCKYMWGRYWLQPNVRQEMQEGHKSMRRNTVIQRRQHNDNIRLVQAASTTTDAQYNQRYVKYGNRKEAHMVV